MGDKLEEVNTLLLKLAPKAQSLAVTSVSVKIQTTLFVPNGEENVSVTEPLLLGLVPVFNNIMPTESELSISTIQLAPLPPPAEKAHEGDRPLLLEIILLVVIPNTGKVNEYTNVLCPTATTVTVCVVAGVAQML